MPSYFVTDDDIRAAAAGRPLQPLRLVDGTLLTSSPALGASTTTSLPIRVMGNASATVFLKPQTVVGTVTCTLEKRLSDGTTIVGSGTATDVAMASGTLSTIKRSDIDGDEFLYLKIVVAAASSILFGNGAAEYKAL